MAQVDTVIPNSINYTDIKPQAIENKIQLCRYQPTATVTGAKGGDMVKFLLSGNGFLDPYSTYFQFIVEINDLREDEMRFLDRSAHSFFQRIVVRSQGVEIERIENYDVIAAMINDMLYSPEQCTQHYWEGFPTHQWNWSGTGYGLQSISYIPNGDKTVGGESKRASLWARETILRWLCQGASPSIVSYVGETCFHAISKKTNTERVDIDGAPHYDADYPVDFIYFPDYTVFKDRGFVPAGDNQQQPNAPSPFPNDLLVPANCAIYPVQFAYHVDGYRVPAMIPDKLNNGQFFISGTTAMQFIVPIYSGIIGLLMPEKKLLPLNLLPLDIEIVFNPHALYSSFSQSAGGRRDYRVTQFFLYGNTMFFEQEIHRTLEASVADHGLFIYCNSFHSAPQQLFNGDTLPTAMYISMNLKSINSVHFVFMYSHFETSTCARKLHFVSHNIWKMQLLNGTQLIPQYPVEGNMGSSQKGEQLQFVIELYKAWNKMHDPARDGSHHAYNTCGDQYAGQFDPLYKFHDFRAGYDQAGDFTNDGISWGMNSAPVEGFSIEDHLASITTMAQIANKQGLVGRCQYGISLEGEELGSDRTMITGRKSQYPFQLQIWSRGKTSQKPSYMLTFLRADYIVYIRPDLQIVTLGK